MTLQARNIPSSYNNGARAKILRALALEGLLPTPKIAEHTGLTVKQATENTSAAKNDGLVSAHRDDVTGQRAYKLTEAGRQWVADRGISLKRNPSTPPAAKPPADPSPADITLASQLAAIGGESACVAVDETDSNPLPPADDESHLSPAPADDAGAPEEEITVSEADPLIDESPTYAVTGEMENCLWSTSRLEDAIALATRTSEVTGSVANVYRLVWIGQTRITVDYVGGGE